MDIDKNQAEEFKFKHGRGENVTRHLDTVEDYESEEEEYDSGCDESSDSEWNSQIQTIEFYADSTLFNCCPFLIQ